MTLNDYYCEFGTKGLAKLAQKTGSSIGYLQQLIYSPRNKTDQSDGENNPRIPSLGLAKKLVAASDQLLTLEDLANPVKKLPRDQKKTCHKRMHNV